MDSRNRSSAINGQRGRMMFKLFKRGNRAAKSHKATGTLESSTRPVIESLECRQLLSVPAAPFGLKAAMQSNTQVSLSWYDNSSDESGFRVDRQIAGGWYQTVATLGAG